MGGWTFLYPAFLAGAAAIAVPIVLHLLKRESAPLVAFSATHFVERAPIEQARRRRLRELLLLVLRVAALLLLAGSFARPYLDSQVAGAAGGITVVTLDRSFSMAGPERVERARRMAREAIAAAPAGAAVALVAFDDSAHVIAAPTFDRRAVAASIDSVTPGFGGTRYRTALQTAARVIGATGATGAMGVTGARPGRVVMVTDIQRAGWESADEGAVPEGVDVEVRDIGVADENAGIAAIRREGNRVAATVTHSGAGDRPVRVTLSIEGREIEASTARIAGEASIDVRFTSSVPAFGEAVVSVDDPRGLPADNIRYLVLDPPAAPAVLLIGSGRGLARSVYYVERGLAASADRRAFDVRTRASDTLDQVTDEELNRQAAVLVMASEGLTRRAREALARYVERGGGLLLAAGPEVDAAETRALAGGVPSWTAQPARKETDVALAPVDVRHPVFRAFGSMGALGSMGSMGSMGSITAAIGRARFQERFALEAQGDIVARFSDGSPALTEHRVGQGRFLVFASDLNHRWNDLPLQPTFVPFLHEMTRYLAGQRTERSDYTVGEAPAGLPEEPGFKSLPGTGRRVAINVDPRESNLARVTPAEFDKAIPRIREAAARSIPAEAHERERAQGYWRYGLMTMLAALALEGLVGRRLA